MPVILSEVEGCLSEFDSAHSDETFVIIAKNF
jgi:hypothetical protein